MNNLNQYFVNSIINPCCMVIDLWFYKDNLFMKVVNT